jgi:Concanavalin A-like lectin/glucanases superfamily/F5/8 type C domain
MKSLYKLFVICFISNAVWAQMALPIQQAVLPKNNLVVHYDFSKSATFTRGATSVNNLSGNSTGNASIVNSPIFINSLGYVSLDGVNEYLVTSNLRPYFKSVNSSVQSSFSMSFWIYPTAASGVVISELDSQTPSSGWHASTIELVNNVFKYRLWPSSTAISSTSINLNQWYHVAISYDGTTLKAYLNGVLQGNLSFAREIPPSSQNFAIGATEATIVGSSAYGKFNLAQFKVHNVPLNDSEILQEYNTRKDEFDYSVHSPNTNTTPIYWSASSVWAGDGFGGAGHFSPWLNSDLGWAAGANNTSQWITLNYDDPTFIKGIVIQPRAASGGQWITKADIQTSLTGSAPWTTVLSNVTINSSTTEDNRVLFPNAVFAKSVRLVPLTWNNHITIRMGLLLKPIVYTTNNLVMHYNPGITESYSGTGTALNDLTINGLHGTMSNVTYSNSVLTFNGSNSQVNIPDNANLEPGTGSWTIEVWMKPASLSSGTVIGKYSNGGNSANISYALRLVGSAIRADFSNGSTALTTDNYSLIANNWVHMVYVWDKTNNNIYTYANGVLKQTKAITISGGILNTATNLYIGSYNGGEYSQYYNGQIGIVRLYKKAMSAAEVTRNYETNKGTYGVIQGGLVMNLINPASSGSTWNDVSGNGNNATLVNAPTYTASNGGGYTTASGSYISTNYNLPNTFTVSIAAAFNPSTYWGTIWANESWTAGRGYISYFKNASAIDIGSATGQSSVNIDNYNTVHIWDYVVTGTSYVLYKDGAQVGTGTFATPAGGLSTNGLYFGARHTNAGTSAQDFCPGTYHSMRVYNRALSFDEIKSNFAALRSTYGL